MAAVRLIEQHAPAKSVVALCAALGVGKRQLHRRFMAAVGYGPKRYIRVARFQRLLRLMRERRANRDWAGLAVDAGYADQAHMVNEVSALAGLSPAKLGL